MSTAYPLMWPDQWPRTEIKDRVLGKYRLWQLPVNGRRLPWTFRDTLTSLERELSLLGTSNIVVSSDFRTDAHGNPIAAGRRPTDQGVAAHFELGGAPMVIAYDAYVEAEANMRALTLAVVAIRSIGLHGGGHILLRALGGFAAPPPYDAAAVTRHEAHFHRG